jgi:hypothetical protein
MGRVAARVRERLELPMTIAVAARWGEAIGDGHGDEDVGAVVNVASRAAARA